MTDGLSEAYEAKMWDVFCENNDLLLENDQLKAENAKLCELVWRLFEVDRIGATSNEWREIRELARELGVDA